MVSKSKGNEAYYKTISLLKSYSDLVKYQEITGVHSDTLDMLNKAIEVVKNEPYLDVIKYYYFNHLTMEKTAYKLNIDLTGAYKHRKRLVKRLSIILFGDEGLE